MRKSSKKVILAVVTGMALMLAAGCGSSDSTSSSNDKKQESTDKPTSTNDSENDDSADEEQVFEMQVTFVNNTDFDIYSLYSSETDVDDWEEDVLGDSIMEPGDYIPVNFTYTGDSTVWDFAIEDSEGNTLEFYDVDFSEYDEEEGVTIYLDADGTAEIYEGSDHYTGQ